MPSGRKGKKPPVAEEEPEEKELSCEEEEEEEVEDTEGKKPRTYVHQELQRRLPVEHKLTRSSVCA